MHLRDIVCVRVQAQAAVNNGAWQPGRWCVHCGGDVPAGVHSVDCPQVTGLFEVTPFMVAGAQRCSRCDDEFVMGDSFYRAQVTEESPMWRQVAAIAEQNGVDPHGQQFVVHEVVCLGCAAAAAGLGLAQG